ncbi:MAG TPA: hypothetical protein VJ246_03810, partial [Patescibacteria group bacterium]|nr:hypothetical protein [Patescibacteria group bacterium]
MKLRGLSIFSVIFSVVAVLLLSLSFLLLPRQAYAQLRERSLVRPVIKGQQETEKEVSDCAGNGVTCRVTFMQGSFFEVLSGAGTGILGSKESGNVTGAVPQIGNVMAAMISNPPASTQVWLADILQHSPIIPQAYAQGIGFRALDPVLPIWKAFRDLAYVFYVIAFVIIGFMIMFRQKLGGQTVVTITSAIPNLIITLLMITFSYAIAGFMIDLMYLSIYIIIGLLQAQGLLQDTYRSVCPGAAAETCQISPQNIALSNNIFFNGIQMIFGGTGPGADGASVVGNSAQAVGDLVAGFFSFSTNADVQGAINTLVGGSTSVIAYLIFAIAIFFAVVKTFFQLLMSYVTFIVGVILSPIQLITGAFTGKTDFWQWIKNMLASLAPFPVVITMIFFAMILSGPSAGGTGTEAGFLAPQISLFNADGTGNIGAIRGLIAIGVLMLMPEAVKLSKEWIGAKDMFEKYLGMINANLQKGWKGGQVVEGFGPQIPGIQKILPGAASLAGQTALGGVGGAVVGGYSQRGQGLGKIALGTMVGGAAGASIPAANKYVIPAVEKVTKFGKDRIGDIRTAEEIATAFTPERVPVSPMTTAKTEAVSGKEGLRPTRGATPR